MSNPSSTGHYMLYSHLRNLNSWSTFSEAGQTTLAAWIWRTWASTTPSTRCRPLQIHRRRYLDLYRYTKLSRHLYPYLYLPPPGDGVAAGGLAGLAPGLADDVRVVAQVSRYLLSMSIRFNLQYLQPPVSPHHGPRAHVPVHGSQQRVLAPLVRRDTWHMTRDTWTLVTVSGLII